MTKEEMASRLEIFYNNNIKDIDYNNFTEEKTKNALIRPFLIDVLGYNESDFDYEQSATLYTKNNLKSDITVLREGRPEILIETKSANFFKDISYKKSLKKQEDAYRQLSDYVALVSEAKIGIISDGLLYKFFISNEKTNRPYSKYFAKVDFNKFSEGDFNLYDNDLDTLVNFHKNNYSLERLRFNAFNGMLGKKLIEIIGDNLEKPSKEWSKLLISKEYVKDVLQVSSVPAKITEMYPAIVDNAFKYVISKKIKRITDPTNQDEVDDDNGIVFTEKEARLYTCIKLWLEPPLYNKYGKEQAQTILNNIQYKDYKGHFIIYYQQIKKGSIVKYYDNKDIIDLPALGIQDINCQSDEFCLILDDVIKSLEIKASELG